MPVQAPSFREYLSRREAAIKIEKPLEEKPQQICNLFNEKTFYQAFIKDLDNAQEEVIIYSPFVSKYRSDFFRKTMVKLKKRNINVFIFTRLLEEHNLLMRSEITCALNEYKELGVDIFCLPGLIHEKVAIIDRKVLWEGSLNILSQRVSKEMMRRTTDEDSTMQVLTYLGLNKKLAEAYKQKYDKLCRYLIDDKKQNFKLKILMFLIGLAVPVTIWWLFYVIKSMMSWFGKI